MRKPDMAETCAAAFAAGAFIVAWFCVVQIVHILSDPIPTVLF